MIATSARGLDAAEVAVTVHPPTPHPTPHAHPILWMNTMSREAVVAVAAVIDAAKAGRRTATTVMMIAVVTRRAAGTIAVATMMAVEERPDAIMLVEIQK